MLLSSDLLASLLCMGQYVAWFQHDTPQALHQARPRCVESPLATHGQIELCGRLEAEREHSIRVDLPGICGILAGG